MIFHVKFALTLSLFILASASEIAYGDGVSPQPRWGHAMAYDSARDRVVLFGGASSRTEILGDTWEWDGASWQEVAKNN